MTGIYLSFTSPEIENKRSDLFNTFLKAGFQIYPSDTQYSDSFFPHISDEISKAYCSVHILGMEYGELITDGTVSVAQYQYAQALNRLSNDPTYKIFVWFPYAIKDVTNEKQLAFISDIRNNIGEGIVFNNTSSPIQLVDDLRLNMKKKEKHQFEINATDVFLVYNQLDDNDANEIVDMLSDIIPVEKLNIVQNSEIDYSEFCAQQIGKSKLAVVYFKESADWALPFAQQIWKKIGGASSHTPILLIGDEDPLTNANKKFKAPKVVSLIVSGELIPLEIKVQFDKIVETIQ